MRVAAQEARITSRDEWREVEPAPSNNTREVGFPRLADRIKSWESSRRSSIIPACPGDGEGEGEKREREREREKEARAFFTHTQHPLVTARDELASVPAAGIIIVP